MRFAFVRLPGLRVALIEGRGGGATGGIGAPNRLNPERWPLLLANASSRFTGA